MTRGVDWGGDSMRLIKATLWLAVEDRIPHTPGDMAELLKQVAMESGIEAEIAVASVVEKRADYPDFSSADDLEVEQNDWFERAETELLAYAEDERDHAAARELRALS